MQCHHLTIDALSRHEKRVFSSLCLVTFKLEYRLSQSSVCVCVCVCVYGGGEGGGGGGGGGGVACAASQVTLLYIK